MKKIRHSFIALLLSVSSIAGAQKITWGQPKQNVWPVKSILGSDDKGFYVRRHHDDYSRESGEMIERYGYDGSLVFSKEINYSEGGNVFLNHIFFTVKNGIIDVVYDTKGETYY